MPPATLRAERLSSAGRPSPLVTTAIMAADGSLLPRGERGEIVVRGSLVMKGYYRNPEATAAASAYGWHHTGDIGYLDDDNYLYIVDRAKDMIITGGFNVYSTEVEQALMAHPAVQDCAVIGRPDEKWGERVVAVVQLQPGASARSGRADRLRQGPDRQRQGTQGRAGLAGPAALQGRQGTQSRTSRPGWPPQLLPDAAAVELARRSPW